MRQLFIILFFLHSSLSFVGQSTMGPLTQPLARSTEWLGNHAQDLVYDRAKIYLDEQVYNINGMQVIGSPFLYRDWSGGTITTMDGRNFPGYKLKYNAFSQTVSFFNGRDTLDVNEQIRQFTLLVANDSSKTDTFTFVNANQYKKEKDVFYYEIMIDSSTGQLLRVNRKVISEGHNGLPVFAGKKVLNLDVEYYYYNKETKKISRIKGNGSNISQILDLSKEDEKTVGIENVDLSRATDLITIFNTYFAMKRRNLKAF